MEIKELDSVSGIDPMEQTIRENVNDNLIRAIDKLFILQLLSERDMYIKEIPPVVEKNTKGISIGDPYSVIYALKDEGAVKPTRKMLANGRERQYYAITPLGERRLEYTKKALTDFTSGVNSLIKKSENRKKKNATEEGK